MGFRIDYPYFLGEGPYLEVSHLEGAYPVEVDHLDAFLVEAYHLVMGHLDAFPEVVHHLAFPGGVDSSDLRLMVLH